MNEIEDIQISKTNRRRRKESERKRMRKSGRSLFTIVATERKRTEEITKSRSTVNSRHTKKKGRR